MSLFHYMFDHDILQRADLERLKSAGRSTARGNRRRSRKLQSNELRIEELEAQVGELALGEIVLAADPVHDLQRATLDPAAGGAGHEGEELLGLLGAGADVEGLEGEAGVADPGEAVVPVALAADLLGERCGRGGHDRAGRPVGEPAQDPRAEADQLPVRALVDVVVGLPGPPALDRVLEALGDGRGGGGRRVGALGRSPAEREPGALALGERERGAERPVPHLGRDAGAERHLVRPPEGAASLRRGAAERAHEPVLRTRVQLELHLDAAGDPLDEAEQLMRRVEAELMATLARREGHRVDHAHRPRGGSEDRLQDQGSGQVAALDLEVPARPQREVTGVGIEDRGEQRRAVEAGHAEPGDGPLAVDQGRRVAVGEQPVVGDRPELVGAHRSAPRPRQPPLAELTGAPSR